jgi:hypothetical protein
MSDEADTSETSNAEDDRSPFAAIVDDLRRIDKLQRDTSHEFAAILLEHLRDKSSRDFAARVLDLIKMISGLNDRVVSLEAASNGAAALDSTGTAPATRDFRSWGGQSTGNGELMLRVEGGPPRSQ